MDQSLFGKGVIRLASAGLHAAHDRGLCRQAEQSALSSPAVSGCGPRHTGLAGRLDCGNVGVDWRLFAAHEIRQVACSRYLQRHPKSLCAGNSFIPCAGFSDCDAGLVRPVFVRLRQCSYAKTDRRLCVGRIDPARNHEQHECGRAGRQTIDAR